VSFVPHRRDVQDAVQRVAFSFSTASRSRRKRLRDDRFTIVANDCWGAEVYKDLGLPFSTPLIGTYLCAPDFMALSERPALLRAPLRFASRSRHDAVNAKREERSHPIGLIGDGIEIQFLHFGSEEEARAKWERRSARMHFDRLFFKASIGKDGWTDEHLRVFDALPIRKVAFAPKPYPDLANVVHVVAYTLDGKELYSASLAHFDIVTWLNQP
jgi:uncharacterized protein (DUF1919 family)